MTTPQQNDSPEKISHPVSPPAGTLGSSLLKFGDNVDQINLYARLKDFYKLFEIGSVGSSAYMGVKSFQQTGKHLDKEIEWQIGANYGRIADASNTVLQGSLSYYSNWLDKQSAVRTYAKVVQEELKLDRPVRFEDLKRSTNPVIRDTANYYSKKAFMRSWPDAFGLVRFAPLAAKAVGGEKAYKASQWMELIPGTTLGLGMKTFFFSWYFASRKTGTNYELIRIWNKTEGVSDPPNRAINQGVNPGELVASEDITALYEAYRNDYGKRDFTVDDPLTGRLFEQVARYLNHNYIPKLYTDKRPDLFDTELNPEVGKARLKDLEDTHLTHARLVEFVGTGGFNIEEATATAIRLEVMARKGVDDYRMVSRRLASTKHPSEALPPAEYKKEILEYTEKLNQIAHSALGEAWPPAYVKKRISKGMLDSYYKDEIADPLLQQQIDAIFEKYSNKAPDQVLKTSPLAHRPAEEKSFVQHIQPKHHMPQPKFSFQDELQKDQKEQTAIQFP